MRHCIDKDMSTTGHTQKLFVSSYWNLGIVNIKRQMRDGILNKSLNPYI